MRKVVYPVFEKCPKHPSAIINAKGKLEMDFNLKNAFHYGYIVSLGHVPHAGQNPFFSLFENNIDGGRELRFTHPGIGADADSRKSLSSMLGRSFALGMLNEFYGYTWFASISNLRKNAKNGWTAENKAVGNTPDFLVAGAGGHAVVEAKGTQSHINLASTEVAGWRTQVANIIIKKNGDAVSFKSWIIATRFVLAQQKRAFPEMLIEDPPLDGRDLSENDLPSLLLWIASNHILRSLERLRLYNLIIKIREPELGKVKVLIW